jgi:hypothetical protein
MLCCKLQGIFHLSIAMCVYLECKESIMLNSVRPDYNATKILLMLNINCTRYSWTKLSFTRFLLLLNSFALYVLANMSLFKCKKSVAERDLLLKIISRSVDNFVKSLWKWKILSIWFKHLKQIVQLICFFKCKTFLTYILNQKG